MSVIFALLPPQIVEGEFINVWVILSNVYLTQHKQLILMSLAYDGYKFLKAF